MLALAQADRAEAEIARERLAESFDATWQANPGEVWEEDEIWTDLSWRVDPDVILRVGNSKAAKLTVDGQEYGMLGKKALPVEYRLQQGKTPKRID